MADADVNVKVEERREGRIARVTVDNAAKLNCLSTPLIVQMTFDGSLTQQQGKDLLSALVDYEIEGPLNYADRKGLAVADAAFCQS